MGTIKPWYYDDFCCIADKCDFTCCGNWDIAVDNATVEKYRELDVPKLAVGNISDQSERSEQCKGTKQCEESEQGNKVFSYLTAMGDGYKIKLDESGHCPLLNECGLCSLVLSYGEESLSNTCHTFPREKREYLSHEELGLAVGCKSVLDLLWSRDRFSIVADVDAKHESGTEVTLDKNASVNIMYNSSVDVQAGMYALRDYIIEQFNDKSVSIEDVFLKTYYLFLDILEQVEPDENEMYYVNREEAEDFIKNFDDDAYEELRDDCIFSNEESFNEHNEILIDILANYRAKGIYSEWVVPVADLAEEYHLTISDLTVFNRVFGEYEDKLKLLLAEESYDFLVADSNDVYEMAMKFTWMAMEYCCLRQWCFLEWKRQGQFNLDMLRTSISVLFRIMGYCDDDIFEYMEECFEEPLWDYSYLALVVE